MSLAAEEDFSYHVTPTYPGSFRRVDETPRRVSDLDHCDVSTRGSGRERTKFVAWQESVVSRGSSSFEKKLIAYVLVFTSWWRGLGSRTFFRESCTDHFWKRLSRTREGSHLSALPTWPFLLRASAAAVASTSVSEDTLPSCSVQAEKFSRTEPVYDFTLWNHATNVVRADLSLLDPDHLIFSTAFLAVQLFAPELYGNSGQVSTLCCICTGFSVGPPHFQ